MTKQTLFKELMQRQRAAMRYAIDNAFQLGLAAAGNVSQLHTMDERPECGKWLVLYGTKTGRPYIARCVEKGNGGYVFRPRIPKCSKWAYVITED